MIHQDSSDPEGVSGPNEGTVNSKVNARARKADAACALKLAGASWEEIARIVGYPTPRLALVATEKALAKRLDNEEDRVAMRRLAGARLDRLLRAVWTKALDPKCPDQMVAVARARELVDRHAKLYGLDAPTEFVVHSPTQTEIERWVATVLTGQIPDVAEYDIITGEVVPGALPA